MYWCRYQQNRGGIAGYPQRDQPPLAVCPVAAMPGHCAGFEAARQIAAAIRTLDQSGRVDEIIVARGGGSREDLWVFNAEEIARAAFRCKTPLISAIGHEIDYTFWTL